MKGIILAGGTGSRLKPATKVISKQLLPIYDKPLIYYPLSTLMSFGIKEILLIVSPKDESLFKELLGDGSLLGIEIQYEIQVHPRGLADAMILGEKFLNGQGCTLILGDNIFFRTGLESRVENMRNMQGAYISACVVSDPKSFGVVEFDSNFNIVSLEEKPKHPKSNWAVPGIYFYDNSASQRARNLLPSIRGEIEITDLNLSYLQDGALQAERLPLETYWLDTGSPKLMLEASKLIQNLQENEGCLVGSPEEVAYQLGWIGQKEIAFAIDSNVGSGYAESLRKVLVKNCDR